MKFRGPVTAPCFPSRQIRLVWLLLIVTLATIAVMSPPALCTGPNDDYRYPPLGVDTWNPNVTQSPERYVVRTFEENGQLIDEVVVPGRPPKDFRALVVTVPESNSLLGITVLSNVPAFDWCYGCSATSAAMTMGYYDNDSFPNMYAGPTNGGVCPLTNAVWGTGECPLSATHSGYDGRVTYGHVDDYWWGYGNCDPDPFIGNWAEHTHGDCTGDFMGTNQSTVSNCDGATTFYFYTNGAPLCDYTGAEPGRRDGCHGMRLFVESRGYTVDSNCSQYIYGYNGNTLGFTFEDFQDEIDAGRPVLIQVAGHTMLGYGYDTTGSTIYIHDTWDHADHQMTWGGSYSGLQHYGVTVLQCSLPQTYDEDFETGDLSKWPWATGGNANWIVTTGDTHGGLYSAKGGTITHSQSTYIEVTLARAAGNVSFHRKVSSEAGWDYLRFKVDGVEKEKWSGDTGWSGSGHTYAVTAGTHAYRWEYTKDGSISSGSDTAWIDDINFPPPLPIIHVAPWGDDSNDGSSWPLAKRTVQAGIDAAASGCEVWVAASTYVENIVLKDGVGVYGGFAGTETSRDDRDWATNITILDGNHSGSAVIARDVSLATVDGFTITHGTGTTDEYLQLCGGGVYCDTSSLLISNNVIIGNSAEYGGGIACSNYPSGAGPSPTITNNFIVGNSAAGTNADGGGIWSVRSEPTIANNLIADNQAYDKGGAMYCAYRSPTIINNTMSGNTAAIGGAICCIDSSSPIIANTVLANNRADSGGAARKYDASEPAFSYCCFWDNGSEPFCCPTDWNPIGSNGNFAEDPLFLALETGDYHLQPGSPCVDAGDNSAVDPAWTDLDGKPRILPVDGTVDMGCFEWDATPYWVRRIGQARGIPDGFNIELREKPVTAVFDEAFYIEEMDRSSGIRVQTSPGSVDVGDNLEIVGDLGMLDGERVINPTQAVVVVSSGNDLPAPLDLRSRAVGGAGVAVNDPGVTNGRGALNVGLLVRYMGMVTHVNADPAYLYVWDGANHIYTGGSLPVDDGTGNGYGVRIETGQGQSLVPWQDWVEITGIVSTAEITAGTHVIPTIVPTETIIVTDTFDTITDCSLEANWNLIGLPAGPAGIGDGGEHSAKPWDPPVVFTGGDPALLDTRMRKWESCDQSLYAWDMWADEHTVNLMWGPFGGTLLGDGYWLKMGPQAISYQGKLSDLDQWISICVPGWVLIGHPKDTNIALEDVKVHDGAQIKTMLDASQHGAGWLNSLGYWWDASTQSLESVGLYEWDWPTTNELYPCHGYWLQVDEGDKAFIIPEVSTYVPPQ